MWRQRLRLLCLWIFPFCKRNVPIAEIRSIPKKHESKRPIGLAKGMFEVPPAFFEPLPDEIVKP
jgi:hypothetical protein